MALVSVIIPTYNRRNMIMEAVDSVLQQDYREVEVLVGDDASTDNSQELFQNIDKRVKFFRYDTNRGQCSTRNALMTEARGEYVIFLDSDDRFLPGRLSKGIKAFEDDPDLAFNYCTLKFIYLDGREDVGEKGYFPVPRPGHWLEDVLMGAYLPTSAYMLRRDILDTKPFDETMITSVDQDCWLRACTGRKGALINEALVEYQVHNQGRTTDVRGNKEAGLKRIESLARLYQRAIAKGIEAGLPASFIRRSRVYHTCLIADHALFNGLRGTAIRWWLAGILHSPFSLRPYKGIVHGIVPEAAKKVYRAVARKNGLA